MDLSQRVTLDDLKAHCPRSFDRTLIDLIAAVQNAERPIITAAPSFPVPVALTPAPYNDADLRRQIEAQRHQIEQLTSTLTEASAAYANLLDICRRLDQRIDGVDVSVRQRVA